MALYEIAQVKKALANVYDTDAVVAAVKQLQQTIETAYITAPDMTDSDRAYIAQLVSHYDKVIDMVREPSAGHAQKIAELDQQITDMAHILYANSYDLEEHDGGVDNIRGIRNMIMYDDAKDSILQRIRLYTNWKYPALEIGCRDGEWTEHLVAADPLYIMDKYQEFLDSTNGKFEPQYQARLRKYKLNNYDFSPLPQKQFGFIFSWNHFNYISLDTLTEVIKKMPTLLRPGGVFMFSFNDGDDPMGVGMAENFGQTYIPKSILVPTCKSVGLEVVSEFHMNPNVNWLEVRMPGTLETVKAHQVLGKIQRRMP
jgi:SAM-dependent methyltransferase